PCRRIPFRDLVWQQLDLNAVLARRPTVVLADELARLNTPDSRNASRCQDIEELLSAGIHVITALDLQYLEGALDAVDQDRGAKVKSRVPAQVVRGADQIVSVAPPAEVLHDRFVSGRLCLSSQVAEDLQTLFTLDNLSGLRERARQAVAELLDRRPHARSEHGAGGLERSIVCLDSKNPNASRFVRKCAELAGPLGTLWYVVHIVAPGKDLHSSLPDTGRDALSLAEQLGGVPVTLTSSDLVASIAAFVAEHGITQIYLGRTQRSWFQRCFGRSVFDRLLRAIRGVHVTVVDNFALAEQGGVHAAEVPNPLPQARVSQRG
ncbi:MAG: histidine kinase, partial [Gemmataceae bacterium]